MRRWNGWGDDTVTYPLPVSAARFLEDWVGPATPAPDASFEEVVTTDKVRPVSLDMITPGKGSDICSTRCFFPLNFQG